jgi:hypothetical protein
MLLRMEQQVLLQRLRHQRQQLYMNRHHRLRQLQQLLL